jgi:outer membrane protein TolC
VEATYLALTGNVVANAIAMAQADAQIAATQAQIAALTRQTGIMQAQVAHGAALPNGVLALDAAREQARAALPR